MGAGFRGREGGAGEWSDAGVALGQCEGDDLAARAQPCQARLRGRGWPPPGFAGVTNMPLKVSRRLCDVKQLICFYESNFSTQALDPTQVTAFWSCSACPTRDPTETVDRDHWGGGKPRPLTSPPPPQRLPSWMGKTECLSCPAPIPQTPLLGRHVSGKTGVLGGLGCDGREGRPAWRRRLGECDPGRL